MGWYILEYILTIFIGIYIIRWS